MNGAAEVLRQLALYVLCQRVTTAIAPAAANTGTRSSQSGSESWPLLSTANSPELWNILCSSCLPSMWSQPLSSQVSPGK